VSFALRNCVLSFILEFFNFNVHTFMELNSLNGF
jgi:hypothetical protein